MDECSSPAQYLVDNQKLSKELFYEALLCKFGNMDAIQLSESPSLKAMAIKARLRDVGLKKFNFCLELGVNFSPSQFIFIKALDSPESGWTEADGEKETVAEYVVQCLRVSE